MFELHVKHTKAFNKAKVKGYDILKRNEGKGDDYTAMEKMMKKSEPKIKQVEVDHINDLIIIKYPYGEIVDPNLFAEYGENIEVIVIDA